MSGRKLVLVDLENLSARSPMVTAPTQYQEAFDGLMNNLNVGTDDLVVVGVNPRLAMVAADIAPGARIVTRRGPNGAESRLAQELDDVGFIARRFDEVVIASGDHFFLDAVVALNHHKVTTTVASLPGSLARTMRLAAQRIVTLSAPSNANEAA